MRNEIDQMQNLLKRKRENLKEEEENKSICIRKDSQLSTEILDDHDIFLLNLYYENRSQPTNSDSLNQLTNQSIIDQQDMKSLNFKQSVLNNKSYIYLYSKMKNYVLDNDTKQINTTKDGKKIIGIKAEDIFSQDKYRIDIKNLPRFSKYFEKITNDLEYSSGKTRIYMSNLESAIESKNKKKQQTLSFIESQNKAALRAIEEKRQKFKHLPKANKEKMDNNNLHKHWNWIVKKEIPKFYKIYQKTKESNDYNIKKFASLAQKEIKKKVSKVQRAQKEVNIRARKLHREMLVFWRKRDKEIMEIKKRKDKYEVEKKKKEEEIQEMVMQKKRLEYLMKQSDIYSFFMIRKMGMAENEQENDDENVSMESKDSKKLPTTIIGNNEVAINPKTNKVIFQSIKVDIDENAAKEGVKQLIKSHREKIQKFDQQTNKIRNTLGGDQVEIKKFEENLETDMQSLDRLDLPEINNSSSLVIEAPKCFTGELKEYQLKGLRWLDNLFEQGINGILADEMGLGKTIQAISFLSHLIENKKNWGPFLVVAPNATLYNWQQEVNRFCPQLKVLPYWGGIKERKTLRKFFNNSLLYTKQAQFHVCITSYQLVVSDEKVFNRVNWQYMILDEAQAIKNINSQRWNTLLSFNCRNRLLLSGTPIQNSMSELWALLHFIMPNLFDSHEQFQEWFSRDIEAHSQEKGELNQEQLKRLHKILKPFMLRRVKKDVENEIGPKVEYENLCTMTERQKTLYNSIKEKLSNISDLFTSVDSKVKVENLMNLVMQFRKVCNHPEIFERNLGKVPFIFRDVTLSRTSTILTTGNTTAELRTDDCNSVNLIIPKLIFDECYEINHNRLKNYSIYNLNNIVESSTKGRNNFDSLFNFIGLFKFSAFEFNTLINTDDLVRQICLFHYLNDQSKLNNYFKNFNNQDGPKHKPFTIFVNKWIYPSNEELNFLINKNITIGNLERPLVINSLIELKQGIYRDLTKHRVFIPKVMAPPIEFFTSSSRLITELENKTNNLILNKILYGRNFKQINHKETKKLVDYFRFNNSYSIPYIEDELHEGIMTDLFYKYEGYSQIELPSFERLIADCAKLKKLDELLKRLHKENHRVLIFCQMTRMIDILEEYMAKRRYTYFRMDGSTNIADRRDMVNEFQVNPKIFAFLLSTRAGGLGVNLTGADTVIFYDNDWNPTMDAQATDRAHRIGQTKVVSVYRLITKDTIEERILKRAKQKQNVQTTVYSGGAFKADIFKQSEIVELLYSEEEVKKMESERKKLLEITSSYLQNSAVNPDLSKDLAVIPNSTLNEINDSAKPQKGKMGKKEKSKKEKKSKASKKIEENSEIQKVIQNGPQTTRNIFAVSSGVPKPKINTLKVDS
jgi:chromatin-remodeling ATPase INO80